MPAVQPLHKTTVAPPSVQRSNEREQLRQAIAKREDAEALLAKVAAALQQAEAADLATFRSLKQARSALEDAQQNERQHLAAVALGEADAGISPAEAAAALDNAQAAYDDAKKLLEVLKAEHEQATQKLRWATQDVNDAVSAALRTSPEVQQLLMDFDVAKRATASIVSKLMPLMRASAIKEINWDLKAYEPDEHSDAIWSVAIAKLRTDADAALPTS